ncbi:MAG: sialate O-acetylesterase [Candidatus Methylacidiphilales bacterium]|nr:sialate O-acetylesterase [Candidatus Methylacidiphilales bacterium]
MTFFKRRFGKQHAPEAVRSSFLLPRIFFIALTTWALPLRALEVPTIFSDHMVLQQGQPLPVWGRAEAGARISVVFGKQSLETVADGQGKWLVTLAPETASAIPATLQVRCGDKEVILKDILVGEVWLCSGQSNMQHTVGEALNADITPIVAQNPLIRLYQVDRVASTTPRFSANTTWTPTEYKTVSSFSAAGIHFASVVQPTLGVPVGLIGASWGATPAIAWTRPSVLDKHPLFLENLAEWEKGMKAFPERYAAYLVKCAEWNKSKGLPEDAPVNHWSTPGAPKPPPYDPNGSNRAGNLANGMLSTVAPFAMRGVIWYQGENDTNWVPEKYHERLALMVNDWRVWWNNPELAFGVVQLAAWKQPGENSDGDWPRLRESQRQFVLADPHAGLAVAIDVGEANNIHPFDKQTVGQRLARWALADVYRKIKLRGGPEPVEATFEKSVIIRFESVGGGLWVFNGGELTGFTVAGSDGVFHEAKAEIKGQNTVEVSSPDVPSPVTVRYAWAHNPRGANLSNKQRLPAGPFEMSRPPTPNHTNSIP